MPDNVGKEKDSVGIAEILVAGTPRTGYYKGEATGQPDWLGPELKPGMLIAYIPYTDAIILNGFEKQNLVPYTSIMATAPALTKETK